MSTWDDLEKQFRDINGNFRDTRLEIQWGDEGEEWNLSPGFDSLSRQRFEALARIGGGKLLGESIVENYPDLIKENDPIIRWYKAVKCHCGVEKMKFGTSKKNDKVVGQVYFGMISRIAEASSVLCLSIKSERYEKGEDNMRNLMKDVIVIVKQDGTQIDNVCASVQKNKIFIDNAELPIEEGDKILRKLPNELTESYVVVDRGFCKGFGGIKDHYQIEVQKESSMPYKQQQGQTIYNLIGAHARVNINSQDSSINVITTTAENIFNDLRGLIRISIKYIEEKDTILKKIDELESSQGKPSFTERYKEFIPLVANHIAIIAPFIPALTQMLTS